MKRNIVLGLTLIAAAVAVNAKTLEVDGSIASSAVITTFDNKLATAATPTTKPVYLMNIKLTDQQKEMIQQFHPTESSKLSLSHDEEALPNKLQLGMNNVPVLDQGRHGTCVTFANTAALDAVIGKGDVVSQLCSLELASHFASNGYLEDGWDGTWGRYVLNQLFQFGYVTKNDQMTKSCSGVTIYPILNERNHGTPMKLEDYKAMSVNINQQFEWIPLINDEQRLNPKSVNPFDGKKALQIVKKALNYEVMTKTPSRVTFGTLLPVDFCSAGACAKFHKTNDTWALTASIEKARYPRLGGHEMVITGYDDEAVAVDNEGKSHKGLLTLRNSWGNNVGDSGDYYMTYDFFQKYALEAQQIKTASDNNQ